MKTRRRSRMSFSLDLQINKIMYLNHQQSEIAYPQLLGILLHAIAISKARTLNTKRPLSTCPQQLSGSQTSTAIDRLPRSIALASKVYHKDDSMLPLLWLKHLRDLVTIKQFNLRKENAFAFRTTQYTTQTQTKPYNKSRSPNIFSNNIIQSQTKNYDSRRIS